MILAKEILSVPQCLTPFSNNLCSAPFCNANAHAVLDKAAPRYMLHCIYVPSTGSAVLMHRLFSSRNTFPRLLCQLF